MKYFFLFPTPFCPVSRGHTLKKKNLMYKKNTARMWCCNTFWEKWVTLQVIPEQQKCFTDELCHCAWLQAGEKKKEEKKYKKNMLQQRAYALAYI